MRMPKPPKLARKGLARVKSLLPRAIRQRLGSIYRRHFTDGPVKIPALYAAELAQSAINPQVVFYESFYGRSMSCSPKAIFTALLTDPAYAGPAYAGLRHVWSLNDPSVLPESLRTHPAVSFVSSGSSAYAQALATAGTLITNSTLPAWFHRRDGQKVVNTWHGVPLKRMFKHESADHPTVHRNSQRNFLQATHLLMPNRFTAETLMGSADILEAVEDRIICTGAPRVDETLNADRAALRAELGLTPEQTLIFVAPTWRGKLTGGAEAEMPMLERLLERLEMLDPARHAVFCQMHNFVQTSPQADPQATRRPPPGMSSNRFMAAVDVLITDYSSIMFDFFATGRQVILYAYDRAEYEAERGMNFAMEDLPAQICPTPEAVVAALETGLTARDMPQFPAAQARFFPLEDGQATERAIAAIFAPQAPHSQSGHSQSAHSQSGRPQSARPRLLMFCGGWKNNGITSSALNLLNTLAGYELDLYVATEGAKIESDPELLANLRRIDPAIHLLHRVGNMVTTKDDHRRLERYYALNGFADAAHEAQVLALFRQEARRAFGDLDFDAVVDFSGYARYWSMLLSQVPARRHAIWQHNDLHSEAEKRFPILKGVFASYRHYDQVISVSEETRLVNMGNLAASYATPDAAITVRNVIRPDEIRARAAEPLPEGLALPQGRPLFAMAGRLSPEKAQGRAIRALGALRRGGQEAGLVLMGTGPLEDELRTEARQAGVEDLVIFAGHIANPFPIIAQADCFVLSSDYEGQPMVLLEALTLGKPVIATDIPGSRSVLGQADGPDLGLLVPVSDAGVTEGMRAFLAGEIGTASFDAEAYCDAALQEFCLRVLGMLPPRRSHAA
jgi:CDP-glycerol glycerophosphotransferase